MRHSESDRLTEPLESVLLFIGVLLLSAVGAAVAVNLLSHTGVAPGSLCVHQPQAEYANSAHGPSLMSPPGPAPPSADQRQPAGVPGSSGCRPVGSLRPDADPARDRVDRLLLPARLCEALACQPGDLLRHEPGLPGD